MLPALGLLGACAAASGAANEPASAWAESLAAQREARTIDSAWRDGLDRERLATEPLLQRFLERYPADPRSRGMRLRLAWLRIQTRKLDEAERLVAATAMDASGVDLDTIQVLRAAILARRGQPAEALAQLRAIGGRLVDAETRELWAAEAVKVALLAHAADDAIAVMLAWRTVVADEHQEHAELEIAANIERLDVSARLRALEMLTTAAAQPSSEESRHRARLWMLETVRASLGRLADSSGNGSLARRLIADAPTKYLRSAEGERLRRLAQSSDVPESVMHAAIGLLLELDDDRASRQSAEIVTGAMRAIASAAKDEPVRLITREIRAFEASDVQHAVSALIADGAALLIAGLSARTATLAAQVAAAQHTAIVLLTQPGKPEQSSPFVFFVESPDAQAQRLFREAVGESHNPAQLANEDAFCRMPERQGWSPSFLGSRGDVLVLADAACAVRLADELRTRDARIRVWLGPDAASVADAFDSPMVITSPAISRSSVSKPVELWFERFQRLPSWQEAVGYDVARLGFEAIKRRGFESLRGDAVVRAARLQMRDDLARVECELMSSNERGFRGGAALRATVMARRGFVDKAAR